MSGRWRDVRASLVMALPAIATNVLATSLQLVDASFLGHIGTAELAAASLGNAYFNMVWYAMLGCATALRLPWRRPAPQLLPPVPQIFTPDDSRPVVLFDGECNLCNRGVNLLLDRDRCDDDERGNLRVAALQSGVGRTLCARLPPDQYAKAVDAETGAYKSIVVQGAREAWVGSAAVLKIGRQLRGPLGWLAALGSVVPRLVLDPAYGFVSRRRKLWFGESDQCRVWDDDWEQRFVDDAVLRGDPG